MYYSAKYLNGYLIHHSYKPLFVFGPFQNEGDAHFVAEMLNSGKLTYNEGEEHGKEDTKDTHTVY